MGDWALAGSGVLALTRGLHNNSKSADQTELERRCIIGKIIYKVAILAYLAA